MSEHAAPGVKAYIGVLVVLLVGTAVTVAAAQADLGHAGNILLGLGIAVIKASLVVLIFMQMKYEHRWWAVTIFFPLALITIIVCANLPDTGLNGPAENGPHGLTTPAQVYDAKEKRWVDPVQQVHPGGGEHP
jgi:cytochrome c oxidase subunit 4